jgi:hypothetical protein
VWAEALVVVERRCSQRRLVNITSACTTLHIVGIYFHFQVGRLGRNLKLVVTTCGPLFVVLCRGPLGGWHPASRKWITPYHASTSPRETCGRISVNRVPNSCVQLKFNSLSSELASKP